MANETGWIGHLERGISRLLYNKHSSTERLEKPHRKITELEYSRRLLHAINPNVVQRCGGWSPLQPKDIRGPLSVFGYRLIGRGLEALRGSAACGIVGRLYGRS